MAERERLDRQGLKVGCLSVWYLACLAAGVFFAWANFIWRTPYSIWMMAIPCVAPCLLVVFMLLAVPLGVRCCPTLKSRRSSAVHTVAGLAVLVSVGYLGAISNEKARDMIFESNYPQYRKLARRLLDLPVSKAHVTGSLIPRRWERNVEQSPDPGIGVYEVNYTLEPRRRVLKIYTDCGPTIEGVFYSPSPLPGEFERERIRQVRKDDLGWWYYTVR